MIGSDSFTSPSTDRHNVGPIGTEMIPLKVTSHSEHTSRSPKTLGGTWDHAGRGGGVEGECGGAHLGSLAGLVSIRGKDAGGTHD